MNLVIKYVTYTLKMSRKTHRKTWSTESMQKAIEADQKNEMAWLLASKIFGIAPQASFGITKH